MSRFYLSLSFILSLFATFSAGAQKPKVSKQELPQGQWTMKWLVKPGFTWLESFIHGHGIFYQGGTCRQYNQCTGGKAGVLSMDGKELVPATWDRIRNFHKAGFIVEKEGKLGFVSRSGKTVLPAQYRYVEILDEGLFVVADPKNNFSRLMNQEGKTVIPGFDDVGHTAGNLIWVSTRNRFGAHDRTGNQVIPFRYHEIQDTGEDFTVVRVGKMWGMVDGKGRQLTPLRYSWIDDFSGNLAIFNIGGKCGDEEGPECMGGLYGVLDSEGRVVVPARFHCIEILEDKDDSFTILAGILPGKPEPDFMDSCHGASFRLFDFQGKPVLKDSYAYVDTFGELPFTRAVKSGECDKRGNCEKGKWGVVDRQGDVIVSWQYDYVGPIQKNGAVFVQKKKWGMLDASMKEVITPRHDMLHLDEDVVRFEDQAKWGLMDLQGKILMPAEYDRIFPFRQGTARFLHKGKWGLLGKDGKVLSKAEHDIIHRQGPGHYLFAPKATCDFKRLGIHDESITIQGNGVRRTGSTDPVIPCSSMPNVGLMNHRGRVLMQAKYQHIHFSKTITYIPMVTRRAHAGVYVHSGDFYHARFNVGGACSGNGSCTGGKWGIADREGKVILPAAYAALEMQSDSTVKVALGGICETTLFRINTCTPETRWGLALVSKREK